MGASILTSTKKNLGIAETYEVFDADIVMYINGVFSTLNQLGIGPENGFMIEDKTPTWDAFIGTDPRLNFVKTYVYLNVKLIFDPPNSSYAAEAIKEQLKELGWRINDYREQTAWVNPNPPVDPEDEDLVLDGGAP